MKINFKLRLQNKVTLAALLTAAITFIYQVLGILGVVAPISQDAIITVIGIVLNVLVALGVLVDPTTAGVSDSARAMDYVEPAANVKSAN